MIPIPWIGREGTRLTKLSARSLHSRSSRVPKWWVRCSVSHWKWHHISERWLHGVVHRMICGERCAGPRRDRSSNRRWFAISPSPRWSRQQPTSTHASSAHPGSSQQWRDSWIGWGGASRGRRGSLPLVRSRYLHALRRRRLRGSMAATFAPLGDIWREKRESFDLLNLSMLRPSFYNNSD